MDNRLPYHRFHKLTVEVDEGKSFNKYLNTPRHGKYCVNIVDKNGNQLLCVDIGTGKNIEYPFKLEDVNDNYEVGSGGELIHILYMSVLRDEYLTFEDNKILPDIKYHNKYNDYKEIVYDECMKITKGVLDENEYIPLSKNGVMGINGEDLDKIEDIKFDCRGKSLVTIWAKWVKIRVIPDSKGIYRLPLPALEWSIYDVSIKINFKKSCCDHCGEWDYNGECKNKDKPTHNIIIYFMSVGEYKKYQMPKQVLLPVVTKAQYEIRYPGWKNMYIDYLPAVMSRIICVPYNIWNDIDMRVVTDVRCFPHDVAASHSIDLIDKRLFDCDIDIERMEYENYKDIMKTEMSNLLGNKNSYERCISDIVLEYGRCMEREEKYLSCTFHPVNINTMYNMSLIEPDLNCPYDAMISQMHTKQIPMRIKCNEHGRIDVYIEGFRLLKIHDGYISQF
jgi:hypothetical protein